MAVAEQSIHGVIIDDTYGYGGMRVYKKIAPTIRASRQGQKVIVNTEQKKKGCGK